MHIATGTYVDSTEKSEQTIPARIWAVLWVHGEVNNLACVLFVRKKGSFTSSTLQETQPPNHTA